VRRRSFVAPANHCALVGCGESKRLGWLSLRDARGCREDFERQASADLDQLTPKIKNLAEILNDKAAVVSDAPIQLCETDSRERKVRSNNRHQQEPLVANGIEAKRGSRTVGTGPYFERRSFGIEPTI
jgi:hypothetical protein